MDNITENNRLLWVDITRIIAIIAVVAIHVEDSFIFYWNKIPLTDWWASNIYNGLIRFPVPLFIIVSGYMLLDKQEDDRVFFSKRFSKVVIPLVAWSMIYWIFVNNYNIYSVFTVDFVQRFLADKIFFHLYFLYIIIGLYLITPLLRRILEHANMYDVRYFLTLWFFFSPIRQFIGLFGYNISIPIEAATGSIGLYIIGYAIKKTRITKKMIYLSIVLIAVSVIITIIGTYILTNKNGHYYDESFSNLSLTSATYAACLFILIHEALSNITLTGVWSKCGKVISTIGGATMGIYLVHPILLHYVRTGVLGVHLLSVNVLSPIFSVPLVTFLLVVSSLVIVVILRKIPLFGKIVP
jgi:surface polysaccharide O-acyltransferase-like enzyme